MTPEYIAQLKEIYLRYGFVCARHYEHDKVIVFTHKTGYFDNADIIPLDAEAKSEKAFKEFSELGFACSIRSVTSPQHAEKQLFKGFFSVESIIQRLNADYERFTSAIVKPFSNDAIYKYINAPYSINGSPGTTTPHQEVISRLASAKPMLFLIEAAAGFGKTCNAYELVKSLVSTTEYLPLFSELARNREARIFKHILLDEIDRSFPLFGSRLVQSEMKNGRVITILDGFDELLRKSEDGSEFENREPMLETIGEFLTGHAKVILTTRRTVLFEGDAFHDWVEKHTHEFELITIRLNEPQVSDWLSFSQIEAIRNFGINVEDISNPVLLSYLRCIPQYEFEQAVSNPDRLVDRYFEFMLEREMTRQDLRIGAEKQQEVLSGIAEDMLLYEYTSEHRDYIVDFILRNSGRLLDDSLIHYPAAEKPTKEELANKLASHALLDRSSREPNKIGFINEFVLGHFVAQNILKVTEWLNDDLRFIEPAVISYQPRSLKARSALWDKLKTTVDFLTVTEKIDISLKLQKSLGFELFNDEAEGLIFESIDIGSHSITNFQFNDCIFKNAIL